MPDPDHGHPSHSILLLEDEPVSAEFLCAALTPLGLQVCHAASLQQARNLLLQHRFSLLLLDLNLPDGHGDELLRALRVTQDSPSQASLALALTAELDQAQRAALRDAGFADALVKPIAAAALRDAVNRWLADPVAAEFTEPDGAVGEPVVWDDDAGLLTCGGSQEVLGALRGLFLKELPEQAARIRAGLLEGRGGDALDELHRLLAGCGFCGASTLAGVARDLMQRVREAGDLDTAIAGFDTAVAQVLDQPLD